MRIDKGAGIISLAARTPDVDAALYVGDDTTDLDAFRALAELAERGELERRDPGRGRSDEGPDEIAGEADIVVDGTDGRAASCWRMLVVGDVDRAAMRFSDFLRTTVLISAARRQRAGRGHRGGRGRHRRRSRRAASRRLVGGRRG